MLQKILLVDDEPLEMSREELKSEIANLTQRLQTLSVDSMEDLSEAAVEGIGNLIKRIVTAMINYIPKVMKNLSSSVRGIMGVKRSVLQEAIDGNKMYHRKLKKAAFSDVHKVVVPYFLFNKDVMSVATYFNETFPKYDIIDRMAKLIKSYNLISAYIKIGNNSKLRDEIDNIGNLNIVAQVTSSVDFLKETVITRPPSNRSTIGDNFDSLKDMLHSVDNSLKSSKEIGNFLTTGKMTKSLEKVWDGLVKALGNADESLEIALLKSLADRIDETADMIAGYGIVGLEYHHLEMFQQHVLRNCYKKVAKL